MTSNDKKQSRVRINLRDTKTPPPDQPSRVRGVPAK